MRSGCSGCSQSPLAPRAVACGEKGLRPAAAAIADCGGAISDRAYKGSTIANHAATKAFAFASTAFAVMPGL